VGPGTVKTETAGDLGRPRDRVPSRADFAIVGGGYVGLHTALELARSEPGARIVVFERDFCGSGASGRNGGQAHSWWNQAPTLATLCGREEAKQLAEASVAAIDRIEQLGAKYPEVEFRRAGWLWTASTDSQRGSWDACLAECRAQGAEPFEEVGESALREMTGTEVTSSGVLEAAGGTVNPQGLVDALKAEAEGLGIEILEKAPVRRIGNGSPYEVLTPQGCTVAGQVILTTNAWAAREPGLRRYLYVVGSDIALTEPLTGFDEQDLPTVGLAACDSQARVLYWSRRGDGRIAFGRGGGRIAPFNRLGRDPGGPTRWGRDVLDAMRRIYPQFRDVKIEATWSGAIDRTVDGFPIFGSLGGDGPLYGVGWSGSGVVGSALGGKILASLATRREDFWTRSRLVTRTPIALPPEPLRTVGAHLVKAAVRRKSKADEAGHRAGVLTEKLTAMTPSLKLDPGAGDPGEERGREPAE
jgi:glycine/D-amino acid oxidase-like deaminating enzyme